MKKILVMLFLMLFPVFTNAVVVTSKSAILMDEDTGRILYSKGIDDKRLIASTTKIMTACIIIENCNLSDVIEVSRSAANIGGSRLGLRLGDKVSIKDLLYGLMLKSGNDCAVALAEYCGGDIDGFATLMNKKATELRFEKYSFLYSSWFR